MPGESAARTAEKVKEEGFAILQGAIPPELVASLRDASLRCMQELAVPFGTNVFLGERTRRLFNLLARDRIFEGVPVHAAVLPVIEQVLDEDLLLSSLTAIEMHPGQTAQPLHADDGSINLPRPHPAITCTALWALSDFTADNGATRLVPGSHLSERRPRKAEVADCALAEMPVADFLDLRAQVGFSTDQIAGLMLAGVDLIAHQAFPPVDPYTVSS